MSVTAVDESSNTRVERPIRLGEDGQTYPIGFLNFSFNAANGSGLAGLLVTDNTGIPLEFILTTAVRTTAAQRILYTRDSAASSQ